MDYSTLLNPVHLSTLVDQWLLEDTPSFDYGGFVVGSKQEEAVLLAKSSGILAGVPFVNAVMGKLDCSISWLITEGENVKSKTEVAKVIGPVNKLLLAERVALNCLSRCSGVATYGALLKQIGLDQKWKGTVAGTRKTTPGFRMVEKYGLQIAGIDTHRYDLSSMVMLKDNHIWSYGSIRKVSSNIRGLEISRLF